MEKMLAYLQIVVAGLLFAFAAATLINLVLITTRPETISVVNTMIGQGVLIVCFLALGRVILRRGLRALGASRAADRQAGP